MKGVFIIALAASLSPATARAAPQQPDSLTLSEAIARVLANHPAVREADQGIAVARARIAVRQTAFAPQVAAEGLYSRVGPVESLTFQDQTFSLFPANNYNADVALRHTLYDWGRRATAVQQARTSEASATDNLELVESRLAFQTIDAFYAIVFLRDNLQVQDDQIAALSRHLEVAQEKVRAGTATDFEVLTTQVRIATAQSQRVDLADALDERSIELRQLLGVPPGEPINPAGDFPVDTTALDADSLVAQALGQRPELKLSRDAEAAAQVQRQLVSLGDRPDLNVSLTVGVKNGYVPELNQLKPNFVAGMAFQFPVFNGHRASKQVDESEAGLEATRAHTRSLERQVTMAVRQAVTAVRASQEKIATSRLQVQQAETALALANTRYQAGVVTNLDVLDAQTSLAAAQLMELRARYSLVRSRYRLRQSVGQKVW